MLLSLIKVKAGEYVSVEYTSILLYALEKLFGKR